MEYYLKILIALVLAYVVYCALQNRGKSNAENFQNEMEEEEEDVEAEEENDQEVQAENLPSEVNGYVGNESLELNKIGESQIDLGSCGGNSQFISTSLLPKNDPKMVENEGSIVPALDGKNFIDSYKYMKGAQSSSLRNANRQLRSEPVNPQQNVTPWNQSTILPDTRRELEIGTGN